MDREMSVDDIIEQMGSETDRATAAYVRARNGEKATAFRAFIDSASRELTLLTHLNTPSAPRGREGER